MALDAAGRQQDRFVALVAPDFPGNQPRLVYLRSVEAAVVVVRQVFINQGGSQGVLYLVISDMSLSYV